jgi:hypothetical protein
MAKMALPLLKSNLMQRALLYKKVSLLSPAPRNYPSLAVATVAFQDKTGELQNGPTGDRILTLIERNTQLLCEH